MQLTRLLLQIPEPVFLFDLKSLDLLDANPSFRDFFRFNQGSSDSSNLKEFFSESSLSKLSHWSPATQGEELNFELIQLNPYADQSPLTTSVIWEKPWSPVAALGFIQGFHPLQQTHALREENSKLEEMVNVRTKELLDTNDLLRRTLEQLRGSQGLQVEHEKMSALTNLVSGIAHEINTPLGSGITAMSFLSDRSGKLRQKMNEQTASQEDWSDFMNDLEEAEGLVFRSFKRINGLIRRFQEVAVDQVEEKQSRFLTSDFVEELRALLKKDLQEEGHQLCVDYPEDLNLNTYYKSLIHVLKQLVLNSMHHGYEKGEKGVLSIHISTENSSLIIHYSDDGIGLTPEARKKIFEPFYTTNRLIGGAGLGMHIVYNLVTHRLKGQISYLREANKGVSCRISFPMELPNSD